MAGRWSSVQPKQIPSVNIINDGFEPAVPVGQLRTLPRNANEGDVGLIYQSIEKHGFYGALVVRRETDEILAGNHRFRAGIEAGAETFPCIFVKVPDDADAARLALDDNGTAQASSWNLPLQAELLHELCGNFPVSFDGDYLDKIGQELSAAEMPDEKEPKLEILVTCKSKRQQAQLLKRFAKEGLECRAA